MKEEPTQLVLNQVSHLYRQQAMVFLEKYNLKPHQAGILMTLSKKGSLSQRELAQKLNVTPPSITVAIQKMEQEGYLTRRHDEKDQRVIRLYITEQGQTCIDAMKGVFNQLEEILFKGISVEEKLLFRRLMIEMRGNLIRNLQKSGVKICPGADMSHKE